jgi:N-acetyl-beta-hexosaminidase
MIYGKPKKVKHGCEKLGKLQGRGGEGIMKKGVMNKLISTAVAVTMTFGGVMVYPVEMIMADTVQAMPPIIPKPASYIEKPGSFIVNGTTTIYVQGKDAAETQEIADNVGAYLKNKFASAAGYTLNIVQSAPSGTNYLYFTTTGGDYSAFGNEGYNLNAAPDLVTVTANKPAGLFYGMDTIRQMLPPDIEKKSLVSGVTWSISSATISDTPRFGYRSFMIDDSRHFYPVDEIKRQIDNAVQYKMNTLHLHLSDDQGWRLEIKNYPQLAKIGGSQVIDDFYYSGDFPPGLAKGSAAYYKAANGPAGGITGYYTQDQFKDIVAYAQARYMQIIPEFDVPSHTNALLSTYGFLNPNGQASAQSGRTGKNLPANPYTGNAVGFNTLTARDPATMAFLDNLFKEVTAISPSQYIHMGMDEAASTTLADRNWFVDYLVSLGNKYNRTVIGWDSADATNAAYHVPDVLQYWHNTDKLSIPANAFNQGKKVIVSNQNYSYLSKRVTANMPVGRGGGAWPDSLPTDIAYYDDPRNLVGATSDDQILGVEAALWGETVGSPQGLDMQYYPRLPGYAEIGWSPRGTSGSAGWNDYKARLLANTTRMSFQGIGFFPDPAVFAVQTPVSAGSANSYYNMNENSVNGPILEDVINGNNATISVATGVTPSGAITTISSDLSPVLGNALSLDGTKGNYVKIGKPDIPKGNEWTVALWVNRETITAYSPTTVTLLAGDGAVIKSEQYNGSKKVGISGLDANGVKKDFQFSNYSGLPIGAWTHLAIVGTSTGTKLYVNGILADTLAVGSQGVVSTTGAKAPIAAFPGPRKTLGSENPISTSTSFKGKMDDLRIYENALSAAEIAALAAVPSATAPAAFFEDFESGFSNWTNSVGTPSTDTTLKINGTKSFVVDEANDAISSKLSQPINGNASLWFYDTGLSGLNQQVLVYDSTNPIGLIGVGINSDISNTNYTVTSGTGQTAATTIQRRTGWHKVMVDYTSNSFVDIYVDNKKVGTVSGYAKFDTIQLGDNSSSSYPGTPTGYYDDVQINYFSASLAVPPYFSTDSSLSALMYNNGTPVSVDYFTVGMKSYDVKLPAGSTTIPTVTATPTVAASNVLITQAATLPGTGTVQVTAQDGSVSIYSVKFTVLPQRVPATIPSSYSAETIINTPVSSRVVPAGAQPEYPAITFATAARNTKSEYGTVATTNGNVLVNNDGTWVYNPKPGFTGTDSFNIDVDQGTGAAVAQTTVNITINPNTQPTVSDYNTETNFETPVTGEVKGSDADGDILFYSILTQPTKGMVTLQANGEWSYTTNNGSSGVDSFVVKVDDFKGGVASSTVTVMPSTITPALVGVTAPAFVTGVANGTAKTAQALGLPTTVELMTDNGSFTASVAWNVDASTYVPSATTGQTFTVSGTVALPEGVANPNNVPLTTSISVTVNAVENLDQTQPVITLNGDSTVTVAQGSTYADAGATAIDNNDGDITSAIITSGIVDTSTIGIYTITYSVQDAAGNSVAATRTVKVRDFTAPVTTDNAPAGWVNHDTTVTLNGIDSGLGVAVTYYTVDGGDQQSGNAIILNTDGVHTLVYWSVDNAGNVEQAHTVIVSIDKTVPADSTFSADVTAPTNRDVTVTISYPSDAMVKEYKVGDNGTWTVYGAPVVVSENSTVYARGTDAAGNVSNERNYTVSNIDHIAPVTTTTLSPAAPNGKNSWYTTDVTVSLSVSASVNGGSVTTEYQVNDGAWIAYTGSIPAFGEGIYKLGYRSKDQAGNSDLKTVEFKVDKTAPVLTIQLDKTSIWPANHKMVTINATLDSIDATSGAESVVLTSITSNQPDSGQSDILANFGTAATSFSLRAEKSRIYTITYTATDKAGNKTVTTATVTVPHDQSGNVGNNQSGYQGQSGQSGNNGQSGNQ